ncbi:ribosomal protein L13e-domain-containing protein [Mycena rebaudengoi]|nr:ribosomal protein L13e-domain-containing protein [Mycena rebaudengoi]
MRPIEPLRLAVRVQSVRYNRKVREGRSFTLAEFKEAGVRRKEAHGVGIVVDHRRRNLTKEGKKVNVERLLAYKSKLIVFPRKAGKPKKGDSTGDDLTAPTTRSAIPRPTHTPPRHPAKLLQKNASSRHSAPRTFHIAHANQRHKGARKALQAKKDEEETNEKKESVVFIADTNIPLVFCHLLCRTILCNMNVPAFRSFS